MSFIRKLRNIRTMKKLEKDAPLYDTSGLEHNEWVELDVGEEEGPVVKYCSKCDSVYCSC